MREKFFLPEMKVALVVWAFIMAWILTGCGSPVEQPDTFATPHVITAAPQVVVITATAAPASSQTETAEPTADCPPAYFARLAVGYIPALDLGDKKTPVAATIGCAILNIHGGGWRLTGQLSSDGMKLVSCVLVADREYPCVMFIRNLESMNVVASYDNKAGRNFDLCVAVSNQDYNVECE